jgi:SAM-dependent methyltransferase
LRSRLPRGRARSLQTDLEPLDEYAKAQSFVDSLLPSQRPLKVLDIKAGQQRFEIRQPIYVVGVDVLQAERGRRADADEHRTMDLERVDLETEEYDVVLCLNVLEHARDPFTLFDPVWRALNNGGTFVIVVPNVVSVKGLVTRLTPRGVQHWFYARVLKTDEFPAESVHSFRLRPSSLAAYADSNNWKIEYFRTYEGPTQKTVRERLGIVGWRWKLVVAMTRVFTFGLLSADETGIIAVLTKLPY